MSLFYRATSSNDWYEAAIVLYQGEPPATLQHTIVDVHVVRGSSIDNTTETFTIPAVPGDGIYFVAFYSGFHNRFGSGSGSGAVGLGASMTVGRVWVPPTPIS